MSGWWFTNTLGYKIQLQPPTSGCVRNLERHRRYFDRNSLNANGTRGISLTVAVPFKAMERLIVTPFAGTVWLGNGGMAANHRRRLERFPWRTPSRCTAISLSLQGWA